MPKKVTALSFQLPFRMGNVNCYLVQTGSSYVLIDTGSSNQRDALESTLVGAGCTPGALSLILLTHGDFDHTGNAAYLREKYGAPLAMHAGDLDMLAQGNMFANRKSTFLARLFAPLLAPLMGFGKKERCAPSLTLHEGDDLAPYGLDARVLALPGHSSGSIGVLAADGDLFCGDLLENTSQPRPGELVDDPDALQATLARLKTLPIRTVYPGHGTPFPFSDWAGTAARPQGA